MAMRMTFKKALVAVAAFASAFAAIAAPFTVVKEAGSGKDPVSLRDLQCAGEGGVLFRNVLAADLGRSGWFEVAQGNLAADIRVAGAASGQGSSVATRIRVTWKGGSFDWGEASSGVAEVRWQAHRLSDEIVRRIKNRPGMAATRIAFVGKEGGGGMICFCDSDGYGFRKFGREATSPLSPYFAPDGRSIFYTSFIRNFACVYHVSIADGRRAPLANFTGLNAGGAVSPDGRLVAVILSHPGNPELFVINTATRRATRLTTTRRGAEASPCWSPDGNRIAYVSDETGAPHVFVIDSESKKAKRITFRGSQNVAPSWGADGRIAFCTKMGNYEIAVYDPATGQTDIVSPGGADYEDPSWAPDGRHIVCSRRDGRVCSLWVLDTFKDGDPPVRIPLPAGDWRSPDWSRPIK